MKFIGGKTTRKIAGENPPKKEKRNEGKKKVGWGERIMNFEMNESIEY